MGAYGMLGHKLFSKLSDRFDVYSTARTKQKHPWSSEADYDNIIGGVDAFEPGSVEGVVDRLAPEVIINCIGLIKQLGSSSDPVDMMYLNSVLPHKLSNIAKEHDARLIHFSTDCVFSGKRGMYTISDHSDAEDLYGRTKYLGEVPYNNCLTIRSSIIGPEIGTKNGLLEWFLSQGGKTISGYKNAIYSGFTTLEMSRIVSMCLDRFPNLHGVWQVASSPISKFDLLTIINEKMDLGVNIEPDYGFICDRSLDGSEFNKETGYRSPEWPKMIDEMISDMNQERIVG